MELRQQIIELLSEVIDKNISDLTKKMTKRNLDITEIYRSAYNGLFNDITHIINELDERKESK